VQPGSVLVVGYGNTLRGDDGVGAEVAEAVSLQRQSAPELTDAVVTWADQLTPEMALDLSRSRFAVFIDAASGAHPAGSVTLQDLVPPGSAGAPASCVIPAGCWQDLAPGDLLALAAGLYGHAPSAVLVSVGVATMDLGTGLSPLVREAVPRAAAAVRQAIAGKCSDERLRALAAAGTGL
jgi:hydrogenase maturation protease